jgi:hypothetical protein
MGFSGFPSINAPMPGRLRAQVSRGIRFRSSLLTI